jgi:hypothetical protein
MAALPAVAVQATVFVPKGRVEARLAQAGGDPTFHGTGGRRRRIVTVPPGGRFVRPSAGR